MSRERLYLFDTTLRDGAQTNGVDFTLHDKQLIAKMLDELGLDYVEGGYPGANPIDTPGLASFTAGMLSCGTLRRSQRQIADDFERLGVQWWTGSNSDAATVGSRVLKKNVDDAFEILADVV